MATPSKAEKQTRIRQKASSNTSLLLYTQDCPLAITDDLFSAHYWQKKNAIIGSASGRGTTLFIRTDTGEYILRSYLRGGLPGKILSDQFWYMSFEKTRAWQEMQLLEKMVELQLPVPEPVAARIDRSGLIYRNQIIIKRIPAAKDLHDHLCQRALDNDIWYQVGSTIRQFHNQQVYHHDLNIKNIMMDAQHKIWLIDFDKCGFRSGDDWKQQNIARLKRSLTKEQQKMPEFFYTPEHWQALIKGYDGD